MADMIDTELPFPSLRGALFGARHNAGIGNQNVEAVMGGGKIVCKAGNRFKIGQIHFADLLGG